MSKRSKADVKHAVDLLWTHQVRRENAALYKQFESLREEVKSAATDIASICQIALATQRSTEQSNSVIEKIEKVQHDLASTVKEAVHRIEDVARRSSLLEPKIADIKRQGEQSVADLTSTIQLLDARVKASDERQKQCLAPFIDEIASLKHQLTTRVELGALQALESKTEELQGQLRRAQESQQSPGVVIESVEGKTVQDAGDPRLSGFHRPLPREDGIVENNVPGEQVGLPAFLLSPNKTMVPPPSKRQLNADDHRMDEDMLTMQPKDAARESTASEDLDLDENVSTMSYVRNMDRSRETNVEDSLLMLPLQKSILPVTSEILELKQGPFQSWDGYFAEGQDLFRRMPREREFSVVKVFLEGLLDVNQRRKCQQWLNLNGWFWNSIASFASFSTPTTGAQYNLTSEATRVQSPTKVRFLEADDVLQNQKQPPSTNKPGQSHTKPLQKEITMLEENVGSPVRTKPQKLVSKQKGSIVNKPVAKPPQVKRNFSKKTTKNSLHKDDAVQVNTALLTKARKVIDDHDEQAARESGKPPVSKQRQVSKPPSTPVRLRTLSPFQSIQHTPRLVDRKRKLDASHGPGESDDEVSLPRVPQRSVKETKPAPKKRRLPLPPPPAIPILPTSDD